MNRSKKLTKRIAMKKNLLISVLMTIVTTVLLGLVYPLVVTALAQLFFRDKANGQLVQRNGTVVASRIIAQPFVGAGYFHPASFRGRATAMTPPVLPDPTWGLPIRSSSIA